MSVITCRSNQVRGARELSCKRPAEPFYNYVGGASGAWEVTALSTRRGEPLAPVTHVDITHGDVDPVPAGIVWVMSGLVRSTRYVTREEFTRTDTQRPGVDAVGQPCAALIAIRRSPDWWQLGSGARREIQQAQLRRTRELGFLSTFFRRWQRRVDLSEQFDCVLWFEYEPRDVAAFDELLAEWRASEDWKYLDRECDIRLVHSV